MNYRITDRNCFIRLTALGLCFIIAQFGHGQEPELNLMTNNFENEPIAQAMSQLSAATGITIIVSRSATGTVTAHLEDMDPERALEEIIKVNGLHHIRNENVVWILGDEEYFEGLNLGLERRIIRLEYATPEDISAHVQELGSKQAKAISYPKIDSIVLTERKDRINELQAIIELLDRPVPRSETAVYPLAHAVAAEAAQIVAPYLSAIENLQIDVRTNQLIVTDVPDVLSQIEQILEKLDIPDLVITDTILLRHAYARDVAETVEEILTGQDKDSGNGNSLSSSNNDAQGPDQVATAKPAQSQSPSPPTSRNRSGSTSQAAAPVNAPVAPPAASPGITTAATSENALALGPLSSVSYDERTNAIVVTHTKPMVERIKDIIASLDVPVIYYSYQFQNADPSELDIEGKLTALFPTERPWVTVDPVNKIISFRCTVEQSERIMELLKQWDATVLQVEIEAKILLVKTSLIKDLGVKWSALLESARGSGDADDTVSFNFPPAIADTSSQALLSVGSLGNTDYTLMIQALSTDNDTQIIASPSITVQDGSQSVFTSTRQQPYPVVTVDGNTQTTIQSVQFLDVGVTLSVAATINREELITLDVLLELSSLVEILNDFPVVDRSSAQSTVSITNGGTVVLGGLKQHSKIEVVEGVPVLRKIPILGALFRNKHKDKGEFETLLILHPKIVSNNQAINVDYPEGLKEFELRDMEMETHKE